MGEHRRRQLGAWRAALGVMTAPAMLMPCVGVGAGTGLTAPVKALAPEPSPVPRSWELDIDAGPLRAVSMAVEGEGIQHFYYMTYRVTNDSGEDLFFAPMFELATDRGECFMSGRNVPPEVTRELLQRLSDPLIEDQIGIIGGIQQGPENARDGLVVWRMGSTTPKEVNVYAFGFSGETQTIRMRNFETGELEDWVLRKTLRLRHTVFGDLLPGSNSEGGRELSRVESRWIMRRPEAIVGPFSSSAGVRAAEQAPEARSMPEVQMQTQ